jgi:hypothetical protein
MARYSTLYSRSLATRGSHNFRVIISVLRKPCHSDFSNKAFPPTPSSITALHEREHRRPGESYVLQTFPRLHSLYIHGTHDIIVDVLTHLHNHPPRFASLESLELALKSSTPGELYDRLRFNDPERAYCNPWRTYRFPSLRALTLRDIPLAGIALGQLPALRDISLTLETPLSGSLEFLRLPYFARLLACAPHIERLALLRAGPVSSLPLDTSPQALRFWDDEAWRADRSRALPPVLLEHLRELPGYILPSFTSGTVQPSSQSSSFQTSKYFVRTARPGTPYAAPSSGSTFQPSRRYRYPTGAGPCIG